ncbi:MAG TPA: DUF4357 domain-containing protein [Cyclobacteriaceae bacterium]|nr:DUF4357 domain-containing protein [Cyclobacteriaceae bacterium]
MKVEVFLQSKKGMYDAKGIYEDGKLTILKGSMIADESDINFKRAKIVDYIRSSSTHLKGNYLITNVEFSSPSTAAQLVNNASTNGYIAWKTKEGKTLKEFIALSNSAEVPNGNLNQR